MGVTKFNQVQADQFLGSQADASPFGKIWYVDGTNGSDDNLGDGPNAGECLATLGQAITNAVASRGDTVVIYPGTYTITSALAPKAAMTFKAAVVVPQVPSVIVTGNIVNLVTIDVDYTRWIGIEFKASGSTVNDLVALAATTAVNGVTFEDCVFNGADKEGNTAQNGVCGIQLTDATTTATGLVVRRCMFRDLGKTNIDVGVLGLPYAKIEDNVFAIDTAVGIGIAIAATGAYGTGKGFIIRRNEFIGPNSTTANNVGIVIGGTVRATGQGLIRENHFASCADAAITVDKIPDGVINNYYGNNAGGVLVDSSAGA